MENIKEIHICGLCNKPNELFMKDDDFGIVCMSCMSDNEDDKQLERELDFEKD